MDTASTSNRHQSPVICNGLSSLLIFLPPTLLLLALDITLRASRSQGTPIACEEGASTVPSDALRRLGLHSEELLLNFQELESQFLCIQSRNRALSLELRRCKPLSPLIHGSRSSSHTQVPSSSSLPSHHRRRNKQIGPDFKDFCDRLLLSNKLRVQEKKIAQLTGVLKSSKESKCSETFNSFCDRLLLTNEVWKRQKEVRDLREELDRVKRSRVGVITRAAKQMVLDVQKERMIEEFVKDVLEESAECRRSLHTLRIEHERELREMTEEWRRENGQLRRELERLMLAQEAKLLEQEISNELEDRLFDQWPLIAPSRSQTLNVGTIGEEDDMVEYGSDDGETYLEEMSTMSSSTYVGSPSPSPMKKAQVRLSLPPHPINPSHIRRRLDSAGYAGFSFNPLFYGTGEVSPKRQKQVQPKVEVCSQSTLSPLSQTTTARPVRAGWRA